MNHRRRRLFRPAALPPPSPSHNRVEREPATVETEGVMKWKQLREAFRKILAAIHIQQDTHALRRRFLQQPWEPRLALPLPHHRRRGGASSRHIAGKKDTDALQLCRCPRSASVLGSTSKNGGIIERKKGTPPPLQLAPITISSSRNVVGDG